MFSYAINKAILIIILFHFLFTIQSETKQHCFTVKINRESYTHDKEKNHLNVKNNHFVSIDADTNGITNWKNYLL